MPHTARTTLAFSAIAVLPLVWSVATEVSPSLADAALRLVGPRFLGPYLALGYGAALLALLSGVLIGFALRGSSAARMVPLAALPGLWAFLFTGGGPVGAAIWLGAGYLLALAIDWMFWRGGLAPVWWLPVRLAQTVVIVLCLAITAFA